MAEVPPEPPGTALRGLVPPSHFVLRPPGPSTRSLEAELEAEKRRSQALGAELEAERRRSQDLGAELDAERRRSQDLEAELEAERRRSQDLEAELEAERRRSQTVGAELQAERRRSQALEAELEAERGRSQTHQAPELLQARLSALSHILALQERELGRELPPPGVPLAVAPPRLQALLGRWRQKVFALLLQLRAQEEAQRGLRAQVGALGAEAAAGRRRGERLELRLREREAGAEVLRREAERLAQEVARQRGRAEAAEEALGGLAQAAARLAAAVTGREAAVTAATRALGVLSARLRRAGRRLRVLRGLVAPVVALDRPRWQREPAGDNLVAEVTAGARPPAGTSELRRSGVASGLAEVTRDEVTRDEVTWDKATPCGDRTSVPPGRAALGSLVTQLQALGAAILGDLEDDGDIGDPP
ncbi:coiled-coil alpha-helical rod protein 1-like isoform X2 [Anser cygnoides]|uniref:coiled-coil alpha-helical rod protein 1-like isoform X2 n=1 Tax=Anser cygnoides TaxID=8845 RepID=UPI0034D1FD77